MRSKSQSLAVDGASTSTSSQSLQPSSPLSPVSSVSRVSSHEPLSATESSSTSMMTLLFFQLLVMQYQFPRKTHMILVQAMVSIFSKASSANDAGEA